MRLPGIASTVWFLAFVGVSLLFVRQRLEPGPEPAPPAEAPVVNAEDYYLCEASIGKGQTPLVVKYSGTTPTEIVSQFTHTDRTESYQIKERDDIYYRA